MEFLRSLHFFSNVKANFRLDLALSCYVNVTFSLHSVVFFFILGTGCRADYVTSRGKWIQVWKLMGIIAIPILAAWSFSVVSLLASINTKQDFVEVKLIY